jgi:hypothetical protein
VAGRVAIADVAMSNAQVLSCSNALRKLSAPKGDERKIEAIFAAGDKAVAGFEHVAADRSRVEALFRGRSRDPATEFDALSRRYGITKCAGDQ